MSLKVKTLKPVKWSQLASLLSPLQAHQRSDRHTTTDPSVTVEVLQHVKLCLMAT